MKKIAILLIIVSNIVANSFAFAETSYPLINAAEKSGITPSESTKKWMKKWNGLDLEDSSQYIFPNLSGTTSVNLKVAKIDPKDPKGFKSLGSFVTVNEAANPNAEIAYFNLSVILGVDAIFRPAIRYELGNRAKLEFKNLLISTKLNGKIRNQNKDNILKAINNFPNLPMKGCLKAKKDDLITEIEDMVKTTWLSSTKINYKHPILKFIQASNEQPKKGDRIILKRDFEGDAFTLAREFSILLTLDTVFGQYDRFSGGNIIVRKDELNNSHFYATDNGGADIVDSSKMALEMTQKFSRFDKDIILKLKELNNFLNNPSIGYLGYSNTEAFIADLGLYFQYTPERYLNGLKKNLEILLHHVEESEEKYGEKIYFSKDNL